MYRVWAALACCQVREASSGKQCISSMAGKWFLLTYELCHAFWEPELVVISVMAILRLRE